MNKNNSGTALITGASSGLGTEIARLLAERGHDLVLTGRDPVALAKVAEEIKAAHSVKIVTLVKDFAQPGAMPCPISASSVRQHDGSNTD